ncbi:MAG: DinB family protein [Flavitalea sp.]
MKKLFFLPIALLFFSFHPTDKTLTEKERKTATDFLTSTQTGVDDAIRGLSDAQMNFKSAPDRWSVAECVKHIAITEQMLRQMLDGSLKQPITPEKRSELKMTDDQLIKNLEDRTTKIKTTDALKPENSPFKTSDEALASFKDNRAKLITFVKDTKDDLRDHLLTLPFGSVDGYQFILFIGAHSNRHTQQIDEVKADPNFPK